MSSALHDTQHVTHPMNTWWFVWRLIRYAPGLFLLQSALQIFFLGVRVGCTQCHNHPFNDWKQNAFWEMNSFMKQAVCPR